MTNQVHPRLEAALQLGGVLADAAELAARGAHRALRGRRRGYLARRPGADTPLWNACAKLIHEELTTRGAKANFARALGIPRQRLQDFLKARTRLPDAELALRMVYWALERRHGRDVAL